MLRSSRGLISSSQSGSAAAVREERASRAKQNLTDMISSQGQTTGCHRKNTTTLLLQEGHHEDDQRGRYINMGQRERGGGEREREREREIGRRGGVIEKGQST